MEYAITEKLPIDQLRVLRQQCLSGTITPNNFELLYNWFLANIPFEEMETKGETTIAPEDYEREQFDVFLDTKDQFFRFMYGAPSPDTLCYVVDRLLGTPFEFQQLPPELQYTIYGQTLRQRPEMGAYLPVLSRQAYELTRRQMERIKYSIGTIIVAILKVLCNDAVLQENQPFPLSPTVRFFERSQLEGNIPKWKESEIQIGSAYVSAGEKVWSATLSFSSTFLSSFEDDPETVQQILLPFGNRQVYSTGSEVVQTNDLRKVETLIDRLDTVNVVFEFPVAYAQLPLYTNNTLFVDETILRKVFGVILDQGEILRMIEDQTIRNWFDRILEVSRNVKPECGPVILPPPVSTIGPVTLEPIPAITEPQIFLPPEFELPEM
jgi:hypothetical protein